MSSGRLQQSPQPKGGELFRREWWQLWDKAANDNRYPATSYRVASLDGAFTADEANDPSAMTVFGVFKHPTLNAQRIILMDAWRKHLPLHGNPTPRLPDEIPQAGDTEEIGLEGSGIDALVGQRVAAGMPEHVRVDLEADLGFVASARQQLGEPDGVNGPPRSEAKTKGEAAWRLSSRSARNSSPSRGWVAASPPLARRTCIVPVSNAIDDHCSSQSSDTRRPCRKPIRIMVASR
jgi:hypothetical protein